MQPRFSTIGNAALFVLNNTITVVPYMLFIQLAGKEWFSILPFVLFYTLRTTGIFLVRGLPNRFTPVSLLKSALILGFSGGFIGAFGQQFPYAYILAGALLGFSAAWLPAASLTVSFRQKKAGNKQSNNLLLAIIILVLLFFSMFLPGSLHVQITLALYGLLFLLAYLSKRQIGKLPNESADVKDQQIMKKELMAFVAFFVLILLLRSGRLLQDTQDFDLAVVGFALIFALVVVSLYRRKKNWLVNRQLNELTFINGMIGNFLFLFSSLYVTGVFGKPQLKIIMYLPYVLGILIAMAVGPLLQRKMGKQITFIWALGIIGGLLLMIANPLFPVGLFLISFFKSTLNSWLNQQYEAYEKLPRDQRILVKYTTQMKGSMTHQFFLMGLLYLLAKFFDHPTSFIFTLTNNTQHHQQAVQLLEWSKYLGSAFLIVLLVLFILRQQRRTKIL